MLTFGPRHVCGPFELCLCAAVMQRRRACLSASDGLFKVMHSRALAHVQGYDYPGCQTVNSVVARPTKASA